LPKRTTRNDPQLKYRARVRARGASLRTRLSWSSALIWLGNNLAFALLYWLIDSGGPVVRSTLERPVDFAFTQQMSPELAPPIGGPSFSDICTSGSRTRRRSVPPT
jgi:hypothetical protein